MVRLETTFLANIMWIHSAKTMGLPLEIGNFGTQASDYCIEVLTLGAYDFFVVFVSAIEAFERRAACAELQN